MNVDGALQIVGSFGRYQAINILIFGLGVTVASFQAHIIAFTIDQSVNHYCKPPFGFTINDTTIYIQRNGQRERDGCQTYGVIDGTLTDNKTTCEDGWEYPNEYGETVITELDLVCSRKYLGATLMLVHFIGFMVGCYATGQAADTFGRRNVCMATLLCTGVLGVSISFVWNLGLMLVLRFLLGTVIPGNTLVSIIRVIEMFPPKKRVFGFVCIESFWTLGLILVTPLAFFFPQWRHLQLASSLLCFVPLPFHWFFSYESIRWLAQNGHMDEVEGVLKKIAESKNISYSGSFLQSGPRESDKMPEVNERLTNDVIANENNSVVQNESAVVTVKKYTLLDLFRTRVLLKYSLLLFFCWFTMSALYFGLLIYSTSLVGNKYLNFLLLALVELPVYAAEYLIINRFGRRRPLICLLFVTAAVFVLSGFVSTKTGGGRDLTPVVITLTVMGKFFATSAYHVTILTGAEVFPTVLRNIATGSFGAVGKLGTLIVPFIVLLKDVQSFLPMAIFGGLPLIASVCVFLLPETRNEPLPETCDDARKLARDNKSAI